MDYLTAVNRLRERAQWYYALTHNCTTALRGHMIPHVTTTLWSWKSLLNGKLDEPCTRSARCGVTCRWPRLAPRGQVNARAKTADRKFSRRIRERVPGPSSAP